MPELRAILGATHSDLGSLLFAMACGAVIAMPFTGGLTVRLGSKKICQLTGIVLCCATMVIALQANLYFEALIFFVIGLATGAMDVAMNEQAVLVERASKKPIMSSFHAFWSLGMAVGAGSGAWFSKLGIPLPGHILLIGVLAMTSFLIASSRLIKVNAEPSQNHPSTFIIPSKVIVPLGFIAFCSMLSEGAMIDWSAIYVNEVVGSSLTLSAVSFGVFGFAMTVGRFLGDYLSFKLGKKKLLVTDAILALVGLSMFLLFPTVPITTIGLFLVGFGLSTVVPIIYSTAGNTPGVAPGVGIAMATTIGYSGFFIGPPAIGYVGDHYGLRVALIFALALLAVMLVLISRQKFAA